MRISSMLMIAVCTMGMMTPKAQALNLATVDMQRVMSDAKAAKSAKTQLEAKQKAFQADVGRTEAELQKGDQELAKQRSLLSADAFKSKLADFRKQAAAAQKDVQGKRLKLRRAFEMAIVTIQKQVTQIIADIAKERQYDIVVPSAQSLYHNPSLDITTEVLTRLDAKLPSMTVDFGG
jgi:outer membrane protein